MKEKVYQIKLSHLIIGGILLLLLIFLIYFRPTPTQINTYDKEKREIDSLKTEINKLKNIQDTLTIDLGKQQKVIDSLSNEIKKTEKELTKNRTYYGKKIKNLTSSSPSELHQFFTERYK
jgi:septal ring factor EnvC (AmiA/AmiB activator)